MTIESVLSVYEPRDWRRLSPRLHVSATDLWEDLAPFPLDSPEARNLAAHMRREGYVQLAAVDWDLSLKDMAITVASVVRLGFPAVFAFVYDEFWIAFFKFHQMIASLLGETYAILPDFWAWHVDPTVAESGWAPHRDKGRRALLPDGRPKSLTLWLPLTDATSINGCMYVVPADRDPTYGTDAEGELKFALPDIRALPAVAGSALAWNQAVLHWGGHSAQRRMPPRISIALEFQRSDILAFNTPLLTPFKLPPFEMRLWLIGRQILRYRHMHEPSQEIVELAEILSRPGRAAASAIARRGPQR